MVLTVAAAATFCCRFERWIPGDNIIITIVAADVVVTALYILLVFRLVFTSSAMGNQTTAAHVQRKKKRNFHNSKFFFHSMSALFHSCTMFDTLGAGTVLYIQFWLIMWNRAIYTSALVHTCSKLYLTALWLESLCLSAHAIVSSISILSKRFEFHAIQSFCPAIKRTTKRVR